MTRSSNDVAKCVYENTIQENEKRLREARIKSQVLRRQMLSFNSPQYYLYFCHLVRHYLYYPAQLSYRAYLRRYRVNVSHMLQGKGRIRQDLNRFFRKLNQTVDGSSARNSEKLNLSCYNRNVSSMFSSFCYINDYI